MDRRIQTIIARLESRISAPLDLTEFARQVNLSPSRLRHLFKSQTGTTPVQYLKQLRLQRAEMLLRTTFLTIKEIVNKVGMTSSSSFVREFKKAYGVAPTIYRRAMDQDSSASSRRH